MSGEERCEWRKMKEAGGRVDEGGRVNGGGRGEKIFCYHGRWFEKKMHGRVGWMGHQRLCYKVAHVVYIKTYGD